MQSGLALPRTWWIIRSPAAPAAWNMAADEALMTRAHRERAGILRIYSWSAPAITFGRNEAIVGRFDRDALLASAYDLVRRPTGGRALLHVDEVTYAAAVPLDADGAWRPIYDAINRTLRGAMHTLGVPARIVGDGEFPSLPPSGALCFALPSPGEIVVQNAKLVASAVWRDRTSFLQQGSILIDGDQQPLEKLAHPGVLPAGAIATLRNCGVSAGFDDVAAALTSALSAEAEVTDMSHDEQLQRDAELRVSHFRNAQWLWRR